MLRSVSSLVRQSQLPAICSPVPHAMAVRHPLAAPPFHFKATPDPVPQPPPNLENRDVELRGRHCFP